MRTAIEHHPHTRLGHTTHRSVWIAKLLTWAGFSVEGSRREDALSKLDQQVKA
jgi:hypothetical protein